jgi:wyosine [tRNA(Phe)-imidazoG37] synthetase (radical SAM superfamily)
MLPLKAGIVYGPVASRRLGFSLGINLLPPVRKICTFDCAYCQYGWTLHPPSSDDSFPSVDTVLGAVEEALKHTPVPPAYLTFSGHGEPTLHPQLGDIVEGLRALRDRVLPTAKLAVLSNSTTITRPSVVRALDLLDLRIMKLDAGTDTVFQRYCRPRVPVGLDDIVAGLASLRDVTLQTLLADGPGGNADDGHIDAWIEKVVATAPAAVQLYTLDRDWPSRELAPLALPAMHAIAAKLHNARCPATVYTRG